MTPPTSLALYVHWPWCLAKCPYCDFNAHVWKDIPAQAYLDAVVADMQAMRSLGGPREIVSVFFGGGTPSLMGAENTSYLIDKINDIWGLPATAEVTVECNPTSSSRELFQGLKAAGVNRVSIGVQSTRADWLDFLGRKHDVGQALATLDAAQEIVGNVNADLIFGLPQQRLADWLAQLEQMSARGLSHISCYQLTIEPQTHFFGQVKRGEWAPLEGDIQADFMAETETLLGSHGYQTYEISNHARDNLVCRHNLHVWRYGDYAGVGAGAHGRLTLADGRRVATQVTKHPRNYLAHAAQGETTFRTTELGAREVADEILLSGLRLNEGLPLERLTAFSGIKPSHIVSEKAVAWLGAVGLLERTDGMLRLTNAGRRVMDSVLAELRSDV